MRIRFLLLLLICCSVFSVRANHGMGGEITWKCSGSGYVFELIFYRDCNQAEINSVSENLRVWHHPTITNITVNFISREDISPTCNPVAGSPPPLECGTGANGGNGIGAIEKITYRSAVIVLPGTPPAGTGWEFTFDSFSRSNLIVNLVNPQSHGSTNVARMFAIPNAAAGVCLDNSPRFLQDAYLVSCAGDDYAYNLHPVDVDLDSLHMSFGTPLDWFQTGTFNPPLNPAPVPFETGFSPTSPTPDASMQAGNIPAQLNGQSGELTFTSFTTGSYVVKIVAESYRNGVLIAQVEREIQMVIESCTGNNNPPVIAPPFAGLFETTVEAGDLVTFNIQSSDIELLQDGTPQSNILTSTGLMYGTNFTSTTGCDVAPCATLNQPPVVTGVQGVTTQFSWQTDCAHVVTAFGSVADVIPYHFVFRVQDDYCQVPKVTYRTVTINVRNPGIIPATDISCISTAANGDVTVSWDPVTDPDATFIRYELHSVQNGLVGNFPIGTTSATIPSPGSALDFYVNVISGCNGNATRTSDTLSNVYLNLLNPNDGTARLEWNPPYPTPLPGMSTDVTVMREYPAGNWTTVATLPYATDLFIDTIDICSAFLNYMIVYQSPVCNFNSNIAGDDFEDMLTPSIPVLSSVSVDTLTGNAVISWNQNNQADTYGYVIYQRDENGFIVEIDTVWGIANTTYTHVSPVNGPVTYSVAAFDSCFTNALPPTYQTSAKGNIHTSVYLSHSLNVCNNSIDLSWTAYLGWGGNLDGYTVFMQENGGSWTAAGTTDETETTFSLQLTPLSLYRFSVRAINSTAGFEAFSNLDSITVNGPTPPEIHYLRVATVDAGTVVLRHEISTGSNVSAVAFQKYNPRNGLFELLEEVPATSTTLTYTDANVDVNSNSFRYRAVVVDSCGNYGIISNEANTVLLQVVTDQTLAVNYLHWSPYSEFDGTVFLYQVYRGVDGNYDPTPIASLPPDHRFYEDNVTDYGPWSGRFCYLIVAQEGNNSYGFLEYSYSNEVCASVTPIVYIPNAFTPGGLNPVFKPVVSFVDIYDYELTILDRWGQRVFSSNDVNEGWNGEHQLTGKLVELGTYSYVLRVIDGNKQEVMYRGFVTVIR